MDKVVHVDPGGACFEGIGDADRTLVIVGMDASSQAIRGVVGKSNDLFFCLELGNGNDGTKDFFLDNLLFLSRLVQYILVGL